MKENYLDSRSPYIKSSIYGIEKDRKNLISFSNSDKNSSDMLFRQKITNVSKKIVGEEIKKFAEIASKEISEEFANLEKRVKEDVSRSLHQEISTKISEFGYDIGKELDIKIRELNSLISEIDLKLNDLEISSKTFNEKIEELIENKKDIIEFEEPIFKLNLNEKEHNEENLKKESLMKEDINIFEKEETLSDESGFDNKDISFYAIENEKETEEEYINRNMHEIISKFERDGFLFKKNTFSSHLKNLQVKEFLNKEKDYANIDKKDRIILEEILNNILEEINIIPEEESVEEFLKRAYMIKYYNK